MGADVCGTVRHFAHCETLQRMQHTDRQVGRVPWAGAIQDPAQ